LTGIALVLFAFVQAGPATTAWTSRQVGARQLEVEVVLPEFSEAESSAAVSFLVPAPGAVAPLLEVISADSVAVPASEFAAPDIPIAALGRPAIARGVEVVPLIVARARPAGTGAVLEYRRVKVRLAYDRALPDNAGDDEVARLLSGLDRQKDGGALDAGLLIVVPDEFYDNVLPLAAWKERKGFTVWVKKTSETGTTKDQIKSYIQTAYNTWDPAPGYVILIGAVSKIPAFVNPGTPCVTDHPYSCVDGSDYLADLFVGRLPAANASELDVMVAKVLGYEMTPYVADTSWYRRALMVGTSYQEGSGTTAVTALVTLRVVRERLLGRGFNLIDTVFYPPQGSGVGPVDTAVNRGVLYVNGRGWGNYAGWGYPEFLINDVSGLQNGWKLPVVTSIYCGTGNYQANPCFGEAWLRTGSPSNPRGAVAFWGSSYTATSTRWNNCMDYAIYDAIFDRGIRTCGAAMYAGKLAQMENFPLAEDSQELRNYFHVYNLLGDPSLEMWTGVPRQLNVSYPGTFPVGASSFEVVVQNGAGQPVRNALVCLLKPGEVHATELTDASGRARFAISTAAPDTMKVTVTGADLSPHLGYAVGTSEAVFVGHLSHDPLQLGPGTSASVAVTLKNFGASQGATGVSATLRSRDAGSVVTDSVRTFGDIAAGATATSTAYLATVAPACTSGQRLRLEVAVTSGQGSWTSAFDVEVAGPTLKTTGYTVHDGNGILEPGETAELSLMVRNSGATPAPGMTAVLRSLNEAAIQVLDSGGTYGTIGPNDSASNSTDRFQVRASAGIGAGRKFSLRLVMRGSDGYEQTWDFPVTVGVVTAASPLGPDRRGYYAYDDTDAGYPEKPDFNWVEIDPALGGSGSLVTLPNDTAVPVSLPFSFRFYGADFSTVSICDNGFVSMGSQWLGDAYNWSIPSPMGPDGLVAGFWDDFRTDTMGASGAFTWHDSANHRFIVEWSRCIHVHGFRQPAMADTASFQVMLCDPQYYATKTGDGPIIVQFLAVKNDDSLVENGHNFATVGIENPTHDDGLEYTFAGAYPAAAAAVGPGRAIRFTTNPPDSFTAVRETQSGPAFELRFGVAPQPARSRVSITLPRVDGRARLQVFDALGRLVRTFPQTSIENRQSSMTWDLRDNSGARVPAGVYQLMLKTGDYHRTITSRVLVIDR
jgi:hypothetical protein